MSTFEQLIIFVYKNSYLMKRLVLLGWVGVGVVGYLGAGITPLCFGGMVGVTVTIPYLAMLGCGSIWIQKNILRKSERISSERIQKAREFIAINMNTFFLD